MNTYALIFWIDETTEAAVMEVGTLIQCRNQLRNMIEWWQWLHNITCEIDDLDIKFACNIDPIGYYFSIEGENWQIIELQSGAVSVGDTVPIPK